MKNRNVRNNRQIQKRRKKVVRKPSFCLNLLFLLLPEEYRAELYTQRNRWFSKHLSIYEINLKTLVEIYIFLSEGFPLIGTPIQFFFEKIKQKTYNILPLFPDNFRYLKENFYQEYHLNSMSTVRTSIVFAIALYAGFFLLDSYAIAFLKMMRCSNNNG